MPDLTPAPGSTATSPPRPIIFLTVSGVAATRGSPGSDSAAIAIFMIPPTAGAPATRPISVTGDANSDQKIRHQNENHGDGDHRDFHQLDEAVIRLLVRNIIVARRSCVFNLAVIGHLPLRISSGVTGSRLPQTTLQDPPPRFRAPALVGLA